MATSTIKDSLYSKIAYAEIYGSGAVNNANNAELCKWYIAYQTAANVPAYGALFTYGNSSRKVQALFSYNAVYVRSYADNTWGGWYKCTGTAV